MDSLPVSTRLLKSIKWLLLFGVALAWFKPGAAAPAPGALLGFLVCVPLYLAIYRVLYGEIGELFQGIGYLFTPDLLSLLLGEWREDWLHSAKVGVWVGLSWLCATSVNSYYLHAYAVTHPA